MDECQTLEANAQAPEVVQPTEGSLYDPACLAEATTMRFAAPGDLGVYTCFMQQFAIFVVVVTAVSLNDAWLG